MPPASRLGEHEKLEGTKLVQWTPANLRDTPDHVVSLLSIESWGKAGRGATAWGLTGHCLVGVEQLFSFVSLVFLGFIVLSLLFSFQLHYYS